MATSSKDFSAPKRGFRGSGPPPTLLVGLPLLLLLALLPEVANAADEKQLEESDKLPAVQNRLYRLEHELDLGIGVLPIDPFYKGVAFGANYAWHISDAWAVEAHGVYLLSVKTALRDKLENNFGEPTDRFTEAKWYAGIGGMFKPLYGKFSFINRPLVYGEIYFTLMAAVARLQGSPDEGENVIRGGRMAFGGAPGFGLRGYINKRFSVRFDFRWFIFASPQGGVHAPLAISLSIGWSTRSDLP
jgi:outer membrane beta-barrel protein